MELIMDSSSLLSACRAGSRSILLAMLVIALIQIVNAQDVEFTIKPTEDEIVWAVAFARDGKTFAATQHDRILVFDTETRKQVTTIVSSSEKKKADRYKDWINAVDFSSDGKLLAGARADGTISLWETTTFNELCRLDAGKQWISAICFSPSGKCLATCSHDRKVLLWDVDGRKIAATLSGHTDEVYCAAFSPSGKALASGSDDGTVRLWEVDGGKEIRKIEAARLAVICVCFSSDGKSILSGDQDHHVQIWNAETGEKKGTFAGHTDTVRGVFVLPDNRTAAQRWTRWPGSGMGFTYDSGNWLYPNRATRECD